MIKTLYCIVLIYLLSSCETPSDNIDTNYGFTTSIYIIDSCEYIGDTNGFRTLYLTHKGNCKFCAMRNRIYK